MSHGRSPHPTHANVNGVIHTEIDLDSFEAMAHRDGLTVEYPEPGTDGYATTFLPREGRHVCAWVEAGGAA